MLKMIVCGIDDDLRIDFGDADLSDTDCLHNDFLR
jgi:hypothetical protein